MPENIPSQSPETVGAHIAEYEALRSELQHYTDRIDSRTGIYITAAFACIGYLVQPDSAFSLGMLSQKLASSRTAQFLILLVPVLNSLLLVRVTSFFVGILSISQYINNSLRPRLTSATGDDCFAWDDKPSTLVKTTWIRLRGAGQAAFMAIAQMLSLCILLMITPHAISSAPTLALYLVSWSFTIASLYAIFAALQAGGSFHQ